MEVKRRTDRSLVQWLNSDSEQIRTQALCELRLLSNHDPDSRAYIFEVCAIHLLLHLHYYSSLAAQENAIATLLNLSISDREPFMATPGLLDALSHLLCSHSSPTRSMKDALKALFGITLYPLNRPRIVDLGAVPALFSLAFKDRDIGIMEDAHLLVLVAGPERKNYGGCLKTSFASFWKRQSIKSTDQLNSLCFQEEFGHVF